jgi:thiol-disulfide isomerase/thioredoxin
MWKRVALLVLTAAAGVGLAQRTTASPEAQEIRQKMGTLRSLADDKRPGVTRDLAMAIRKLPAGEEKASIAKGLANVATEGDAGKEVLQAVGDTLAGALAEFSSTNARETAQRYDALARLARYEGVKVTTQKPEYAAAMKRFEEVDRRRAAASFSLRDLSGKKWDLDELRGKVVMVNFWATWCPPCRKELPDLNALYERFQDKGLVVLAISDEEEAVVRKYLGEHPLKFPVLRDGGKVVGKAYEIEGIPVTVVYDRAGKLAATAVDQRTERQFLEMLRKAGLR